jgi:hypothetical protein
VRSAPIVEPSQSREDRHRISAASAPGR